MRGSSSQDDRGVSVAVNHVLAIGITTVLITTLLYGAGNVLDQQDDRATQNQLRTVGDRLANQVTTAESLAKRNGGTAVVETNHPDRIVGDPYEIELVAGSACGFTTTGCLRLSTDTTEVETPVKVDEIDPTTVNGGPIAIVYDEDGATLVRSVSDANPSGGAPVPPEDDPSVAPIGGAVGETRTQFGAGGGSGTTTAGGNTDPSVTIDDVSFSCAASGNNHDVDVSFTPDDPDGNLDIADVYVRKDNNGNQLDSQTGIDISGQEGNQQTVTLDANTNNDIEVEVTVTDTDGNSATKTTTETNTC